jgi:hypothetical protein
MSHRRCRIAGACCSLLPCESCILQVLADCPQIKPLLQQLLDRAVQLLGDELDTAALSGMQFLRPTGPTQLAPELPQIAHYLPGLCLSMCVCVLKTAGDVMLRTCRSWERCGVTNTSFGSGAKFCHSWQLTRSHNCHTL